MSAYAKVLNRHAVFGSYPDEFSPEWWLRQSHESTKEYNERTRKVKRADLTLGGESRACAGK